MDCFPNDKHLTAWAGKAPGKNESAGRNRSARTLKANRYLGPALVQAAHAAGKTDTYLGERYRCLARHRGKNAGGSRGCPFHPRRRLSLDPRWLPLYRAGCGFR
jgi:transposase